jgi:primosomal protein N' (replication factor Y)
MVIVKIALPVPLDTLFSYSLQENEVFPDLIGRRVLVPFGKRIITGVIVEEIKTTTDEKVKSIIKILDDEPVFSENMLKLTKWISEYYFCSWGNVLKAALPESIAIKNTNKVRLLKNLSEEDIYILSKKAPARASIIKVLSSYKNGISLNTLENILNISSLNRNIEYLVKKGIIELINKTENPLKNKTIKAVCLNKKYLNKERLLELIKNIEKKSPKQALLLSKLSLSIADKNYLTFSEIKSNYNIGNSVVKELIKKGYITEIEIKINRNLTETNQNKFQSKDEIELKLTEQQINVLEKIKNSLQNKNLKPVLLHGVTGSGKTLIYFHLVHQMLSENKSVLILVPEISLTPQLIERFEKAFPGKISVLHSKMSAGARYDSLKSIQANEKSIVLGVRSAIFAPLKNLGLIIIDEEHEPSYKQESPEPRYNARDVAIIRAKIENTLVILGSATPSLESMENVKNGKYELLEITDRADGAKLPSTRIINLIDSRKNGRLHGQLSEDLLISIEEKISKKEGVILFLNRRGFAPVLECNDCGYIPVCDNCSVSLTYHKKNDKLHCHYCGKIYPTVASCPACGNIMLKEIGYGTQRIEEDLKNYFSEKNIYPKIQRMDLDTTSYKGAHREILSNFAQGKTDILIGTQMVAKGLDFNRVTLVGIINSDLQLYQPDFRATERTFQLITQVSGRAGRTEAKPGEVIIQTSHPDNYAIKASIENDYHSFFNLEIEHRKKADYPPFSRFCIIEFFGKDETIVDNKANIFYKLFPTNLQSLIIYKPFKPYIYKIRNNFRRLIIIKNVKFYDKSGKDLRKYLSGTIDQYNKKYASSNVKIKIDIDSFSTL